MAWSIVGVGSVVEVTATTHTLTEPAGCASGDLLVACISSRIASTTSITLPTGGAWTLVGEQKANNVLTNTSALPSAMMAWAIRGASAPNLTFTHPAAPSVAIGRIVAYRGGATTTPVDTSTSATTGTSVTAVSVTGLTTTQADDLIVAMAAGGQEAAWSSFNATTPSGASGTTDTTTAPSATWRERADSVTTTGADTSLGIFDALKTAAGATGNLTVTASVAAGHSVIAGAFRIAPVNVSASVTGQSIAVSVGDVTIPNVSFAVDGQPLTVSVGSVSVIAVAPYFGPRSYAVGGPLGAGYIYEDSSRSYSTHYGYQAESAEAAAAGVTVAVTGQSIATSVGDVTTGAGAGVNVSVTGQSIATAVGDVSVVTTGAVVVPVSGQSLAVSLGPPTQPRSFAIGGLLGVSFVSETGIRQYMGSAGYIAETVPPADVVTVVTTEGAVAAVSGQAVLASVGDVTVSTTAAIVVPILGQSIATSVGSVSVSEGLAGVGVWNGSAWVQKPAKVWTGSAWAQKPVKHWNGSAWV